MNKWQDIKWRQLLWRDIPNGALICYLILTAVFYTLVTAYFPTQNGDNIEHLHSSFLVATGHVPYRDFFQHHNPLLWYVFAPLMLLFAYDTTIAEISCLISFLVFLKSLTYVYKIGHEFLESRFWSLFAAGVIMAPGIKFYAIDLRPDNYMVCCFMAGLYYYFCYLKEKKSIHLVGAFLLFVLSFLFAQKAIFPLAILGLTGLYFWCNKEIYTRDMLKALILPIVVLSGFLFYLYHYDILRLYFISNYTFNLNLVQGFEFSKVVTLPLYMKVLMFFAWFGCAGWMAAKNRYLGILCLLFVSEFFQRLFYFSPYSYYYWLLLYLGGLCAIVTWKYLDEKLFFLRFVSIGTLLFMLWNACTFSFALWQENASMRYLPDYVTRRINRCDYVFNGDGMMYNIFAKDPAYYWQLIGQLDVIGEETGIYPKPNVNELILKYKPKIIFGRSYFNKFSDESGRKDIVHYVDPKIVEKYYEPTVFYPIYELKKEYDERSCKWDTLLQEWRYDENDVK